MFMDIPVQNNKSRSVSPMSPLPNRDRAIGFFDMINRRFGRRSHDDLSYPVEEDSRSSSTDSCSSTSGRLTIVTTSDHDHTETIELSCSSSDSSSGSDVGDNLQQNRIHHHRQSTSSIRKALKHLSISSRSLSCNNSQQHSSVKDQSKISTTGNGNKKSSTAPKRILRQPISYTYLKGMSGLPTQRVPRSSVCCQYSHR